MLFLFAVPGSQLPSLVRPCSIADISPHSADVSAARLIQAIAADLVSALRRTVAEAARTLNASHHPHMWDFHACGLAYMQQLNFLDATSEQLREVPRSLFHALMKLQVCHITSHAALHVRLELNSLSASSVIHVLMHTCCMQHRIACSSYSEH